MKLDFFKYLPSEITNEILSRLPIRTVAISKCFCKPWLHLLESDEFVDSHLAKSVPALAVLRMEMELISCKVYEFEDGLDLEDHDDHYNPLTECYFPRPVVMQGHANGLLLLHKINSRDLYVCNPITREYIELQYPNVECKYLAFAIFGFGVGKITGQHKVVRIYRDLPIFECHVHTLGTESWRSIEPGAPFHYEPNLPGEFFNGNIHWLVSLNGTSWISCFDLETEQFSTFSTPIDDDECLWRLSPLGDHLCLCNNTDDEEIVIWVMDEYGDDESWTIKYVCLKIPEFEGEGYDRVWAIKVFEDGDILMLWEESILFFYSSKTETISDIGIFETERTNAILLTPSFRSFRRLGLENVLSF